MRVESNTKNLGMLVEGQWLVVESDLRVDVVFVAIWSKECDGGFGGSYTHAIGREPILK